MNRRAYSDDHGAFVLDLKWLAGPAGPGEVRAAVYALIGDQRRLGPRGGVAQLAQ